MPKQVDFYLISNQVADAKYKLASRLSNKLQRLDRKTLIVTDNDTASDRVDELLWSFSGTSFVAHERVDNDSYIAVVEASKIYIVDNQSVNKEVLQIGFDVLINLTTQMPEFSHHFARIAEIVEHNEAAKSAGRDRYKHYQSEGFELKTHPIEL